MFIRGYKIDISCLCRLFTGLLFIFSGFVKSLDPMGSAIKFEEYFRIFSLQFLDDYSLLISVVLCTVEMVLGFAICIGVFRRITAILTALFLSFFTLFTLYLYLADPIESCGCFGEFFVLTNGQTFAKNIIFSLIAAPYITKDVRLYSQENIRLSIGKIAVTMVVSLLMPIYAILYLPIVDAMSYEIGADIVAKMSIPDGAKVDEYETTLIYKNIKDGELKEFSVDDTTWHDTSKWEYVDTKTTLISKGFRPEITSFNIFDSQVNDVTSEILARDNICLVVVNDIDISDKTVDNIYNLFTNNSDNNIETIVVTSTSPSEISELLYWIDERTIHFADAVLLSSLMRADVGALYLKNGVISDKFNLR